MKHYSLMTVLLLLLCSWSSSAQATLNVFACEPEWKALIEELGGGKVKVFSATTAFQDSHHIEARPSLIVKVRNADMLVCTGADLESAWLSLLLRQSANKKLLAGSPGHFLAAETVERLEVPEKVDRNMGDVHGMGNPHIHLGPYRLLRIAEAASNRLSAIDKKNHEFYQERFKNFSQRWQQSILEWETMAQNLKGKKAIVYHRNWSYLLTWLGIIEIADLEPIAGIPPSSSHLLSLVTLAKEHKPDFILLAPYQNKKGAEWLSNKSGVPVVVLPFTVGGNEDATDLFSLFTSTLSILRDVQ